jgi:hypothetical protein
MNGFGLEVGRALWLAFFVLAGLMVIWAATWVARSVT